MVPVVDWTPAFDFVWPLGRCVGVRLPGAEQGWPAEVLALLPVDERAVAAACKPRRQVTYVGGRLALRHALASLGVDAGPIGTTARGAPVAPVGWCGSLAVALAADQARGHVGVDVEAMVPEGTDISPHVLTSREIQAVARRPEAERRLDVLLRFSLKEALYKALDPFVQRYVGFHEVEVEPTPDGAAAVRLGLARGEGPFAVTAQWQPWESFFLTAVRVTRL